MSLWQISDLPVQRTLYRDLGDIFSKVSAYYTHGRPPDDQSGASRRLAEHCNGGSPAGHWRIIAAGNRWQAMAIEEIQAYEDIRDRRTGCP
jgi:hypothetical protein